MPVSFVAATTAANANTGTNTQLVVPLPTAAPGDLLLLEVTGYATGTTVYPDVQTPPGWTRLGQRMDDNGTPASAVHIFCRVAAAGDPATVTVAWTQPGQMLAVARAYRGVGAVRDLAFWSKAAGDNAYAVPVTVTQAGWTAHGFANRTGGPWSALSGTQRATVTNQASTMVAQDSAGDVQPGAYTRTATGSTTSVGVGWAYVLTPGAVFTPPPLTPVQQWITAPPMYAAHRGGSADWPEHTLYAYDQAAAAGIPALEASVWRSSDGVWVLSHDRTTLRTHGVDLDITATPWATLATLRSLDGGYPLARLDEALAGHPELVWLVDNKRDTDTAAFLDFLDAHGGPDRIIVKGNGAANQGTFARARGYETWGYYYDGDPLTTVSRWTLLGMDDHAPAAAWDAIKAVGRPVLAHVVNDQADLDLAAAQDADGAMLARVSLLYPAGPRVYVLDADGVTRLPARVWVLDADGARQAARVR